ncbi:hypothetical protein A2303_05260 [Candidatus Falkowbacteria bacterium RIFOXYB2_FULL_47_14]|uniref:Uncharacterized protein n=1 Tax=Candidatus Falkowbacteria bacterium RIFOXYA2_FULL_47_19 TaxID=1797994 RepID=A0A1F5SJF1_9BACT|nr:MAG: hypothetical protein A2227_06640 [Candidatus Falkowbacteria bacterium RIFOXYA2_FULL_47_19]OGF35416.1 MAG: hypothetical protein A2468_03010 [Candidatus Falkowbacteria bacterium RIFOXYC2_FULL_46_15]OGF43323.1 MAG: hypothetical protein A2303_05260 [Candidatus Falkowbacteria bacterium RIFOXYB2_FULL_47_14]
MRGSLLNGFPARGWSALGGNPRLAPQKAKLLCGVSAPNKINPDRVYFFSELKLWPAGIIKENIGLIPYKYYIIKI